MNVMTFKKLLSSLDMLMETYSNKVQFSFHLGDQVYCSTNRHFTHLFIARYLFTDIRQLQRSSAGIELNIYQLHRIDQVSSLLLDQFLPISQMISCSQCNLSGQKETNPEKINPTCQQCVPSIHFSDRPWIYGDGDEEEEEMIAEVMAEIRRERQADGIL